MAIPKLDELLAPFLRLATEQDLTRPLATQTMSELFRLSEAERAEQIPSGATYISSRTGWAMTFLTKGQLIERIAPKTYRATDAGREMLAKHAKAITLKDLEQIPGWKEAWKSKKREGSSSVAPSESGSETPYEAIDRAVEALHGALRMQVVEHILAQTPKFFEYLVLDVLVAMGYGGSREDAAQHMGKSNDEGIDGCINQDPLGLDKIFVQAKRYKPGQTIGREAIQAFVGSLTGQGVTKGVFITTSSFARTAAEFVMRGSSTKVVLIDGDMLVDLMMRHKIGVRSDRSVELLALDQNYFSEEE